MIFCSIVIPVLITGMTLIFSWRSTFAVDKAKRLVGKLCENLSTMTNASLQLDDLGMFTVEIEEFFESNETKKTQLSTLIPYVANEVLVCSHELAPMPADMKAIVQGITALTQDLLDLRDALNKIENNHTHTEFVRDMERPLQDLAKDVTIVMRILYEHVDRYQAHFIWTPCRLNIVRNCWTQVKIRGGQAITESTFKQNRGIEWKSSKDLLAERFADTGSSGSGSSALQLTLDRILEGKQRLLEIYLAARAEYIWKKPPNYMHIMTHHTVSEMMVATSASHNGMSAGPPTRRSSHRSTLAREAAMDPPVPNLATHASLDCLYDAEIDSDSDEEKEMAHLLSSFMPSPPTATTQGTHTDRDQDSEEFGELMTKLEENKVLRNIHPRGAFMHRLLVFVGDVIALKKILSPSDEHSNTAVDQQDASREVEGLRSTLEVSDSNQTSSNQSPAEIVIAHSYRAIQWMGRIAQSCISAIGMCLVSYCYPLYFAIDRIAYFFSYMIDLLTKICQITSLLFCQPMLYCLYYQLQATCASPSDGASESQTAAVAVAVREAFKAEVTSWASPLIKSAQGIKIALAIAITSLLVVVDQFRDSYQNGLWAVVVIALIRQETTASSFLIGLQRLEGTVIGAVYSFTLYQAVGCTGMECNTLTVLFPIMVPWVVFCTYFREGPYHGYAALVAALTPFILFLGPNTSSGTDIVWNRVERTFIGIAIYLIVDNLIFPRSASTTIRQGIVDVLRQIHQLENELFVGLGHLGLMKHTTASIEVSTISIDINSLDTKDIDPLHSICDFDACEEALSKAQTLLTTFTMNVAAQEASFKLVAYEPDLFQRSFPQKHYPAVMTALTKVLRSARSIYHGTRALKAAIADMIARGEDFAHQHYEVGYMIKGLLKIHHRADKVLEQAHAYMNNFFASHSRDTTPPEEGENIAGMVALARHFEECVKRVDEHYKIVFASRDSALDLNTAYMLAIQNLYEAIVAFIYDISELGTALHIYRNAEAICR